MLTPAVTFFCLSTGGGRKNVKGRNLLGVEGPYSAGKGSLSKTMRLGEKIGGNVSFQSLERGNVARRHRYLDQIPGNVGCLGAGE